jgi:hypothetical protein
LGKISKRVKKYAKPEFLIRESDPLNIVGFPQAGKNYENLATNVNVLNCLFTTLI